jgi:hypothetical protein
MWEPRHNTACYRDFRIYGLLQSDAVFIGTNVSEEHAACILTAKEYIL